MFQNVDVELTEMAVMNWDYVPKRLHGWRLYRVEYGRNDMGHSDFETTIWLPPHAAPEQVEDLFKNMQVHEQRITGEGDHE